MSELAPKLLSDFDGTAVRKYGYTNWRNWGKYPLPGIPGYLDFLAGVQEEGVDFEGVVTIRKEFWRQGVTNRSLRKLGYTGVISPDMVAYAGTEEAKGRVVVNQSRETTVGMIDDKPHKLGIAMLDAVEASSRLSTYHPVLLGVVSHERSADHIERLVELAEGSEGDLPVSIGTSSPSRAWEDLAITKGPFTMHVRQLDPYSQAEGQQFGQRLGELAAA